MANDKEVISSPAPEPKPKKSPVAILMVLSVAVMVLTPVITVMTFRIMNKESVAAGKPEKVQSVEIPLPRIQVNVAEANGTRYAQMDIVVEVSDPTMEGLLSDKSPGEVNYLNRVMAMVIRITGDKPISALLTSAGKQKLALELKEAMNDFLADKTSGLVTEVYFSGFLIQ